MNKDEKKEVSRMLRMIEDSMNIFRPELPPKFNFEINLIYGACRRIGEVVDGELEDGN